MRRSAETGSLRARHDAGLRRERVLRQLARDEKDPRQDAERAGKVERIVFDERRGGRSPASRRPGSRRSRGREGLRARSRSDS